MKFTELDRRMRIYETAADHCVLPGIFIVARVDGRSFTRLTRELHPFEAPFDSKLEEMMLSTAEHLMRSGFRVIYAYTQSDEISLLFHPHESTFGRKTRKLNSILAGEASAKFSLLLGEVAVFDSRICELPNCELVVDYFRWRQEDAHRNALNGHCYWLLRRQGKDAREATTALEGLSVAGKNELLFTHGTNFNNLPAWQRRGVGLSWKPGTQEILRNAELPMREAYETFILERLAGAEPKG